MKFLRLSVIVGALPVTLQNGTVADATQVMSDLNWIVNQVNANAAPLLNTALTNVNNNFTAVQTGIAASAGSNFPIASQVQNQSFNTLSSTLGTNTLSSRVSALALSAYSHGQIFTFLPSQINSGDTTMAIDGLPAKHFLNAGSSLSGGELRPLIPAQFFYDSGRDAFPLLDGTQYVQGPNVAAAATLNLDAVEGDYNHVGGTAAITAVTLSRGRQKIVVFDSSPVYTSGGSLLLIGGINRTPVSGEISVLRGEAGGVVREVGAAPTARIGSSLVLLAAKTAAASASITFTNKDFSWTDFDVIQFEFVDIRPATDATSWQAQFSVDGTTFVGANYVYAFTGEDSTASAQSSGASGAGAITMSATIGNSAAGGGLEGFCKLNNPSNASANKKIYGQLATFNSANYEVKNFMGAYTGAQTALLGISFAFGSGNITSGKIYAYGLRKS